MSSTHQGDTANLGKRRMGGISMPLRGAKCFCDIHSSNLLGNSLAFDRALP